MTQLQLLVSISVKRYLNRSDYVNERLKQHLKFKDNVSFKHYSAANTVQLKDVSCFPKKTQQDTPNPTVAGVQLMVDTRW